MDLFARQVPNPAQSVSVYTTVSTIRLAGQQQTQTTLTSLVQDGITYANVGPAAVTASLASSVNSANASSSPSPAPNGSSSTPSTSTLTTGTAVTCLINNSQRLCTYDATGSVLVRETTITSATSAGGTQLPLNIISYVPIALEVPSTSTSQTNTTTSTSASTSERVSATPSASQSHPTTSSNHTGAIAGAAVGGLFAGALLAGLVAFFILKKRSRSRNRYVSRDTYVPAASPAYGGEKGTPMVSIAAVPNMDFLPQQADDAEVKRKLSTVLDQIDQHVENFYGNRGGQMSSNWEAEISRFETNELPLPLAACFQNSNAPMTLIKHCLAYHIFNLTMSPGEHGTPLLPPEMAGMVAAMYHKSLSQAATKDNITAFSTWKSLTRYLRPELGRDQNTAKNISESSARIATHFTNVFSPWAHTQYNADTRARHLTELINQAVQTAIWLFGQPDNFKYEWDVPNSRHDTSYSAIVAPAVWKTTHNGTRLNGKGQNVISPVIKGF